MINNFCKRKAAKFVCATAFLAIFGFFIFYGLAERQNSNEINYRLPAKREFVSPSIKTDFGELPLSFEANAGQTDEQVKFISRGQGFALFLTGRETVLSLRKNDFQTPPAVLRMRLDGGSQAPEVFGQNELAGKSNYFVGSEPEKWKRDVPNFSSVRYREVYPGIDQVFYGNGRELEYDFIVAPEADFEQIALAFEGAQKLEIGKSGELVLSVGDAEIVQKQPVIYQEIDGDRKYVAGNYIFKGKNKIGFEIGDYDRSQPLVIDPVLLYSTYLGGSGADSGRSIAVDAGRNVYVTGSTTSTNFPTANPLQSNNAGGSGDVFVTKINAAGNAIVYSTYFGGSVGDIGYGIDVDAGGNIYVTGVTGGTLGANSFPTTAGAFDRTFNSPDESFLFKLNASGNALVYSTYTGATIGFEVKVDKTTGEAFIAGNAGANLPTTPGAFSSSCSAPSCSFVTKFNATGSALVYSTYIGEGPANDLAIDALGNAYITGSTISSTFPITPGAAQPTCTGCNLARSDAFVTKLNPNGTSLLYSTYLGGSIDEVGRGITVDARGNAYVTGRTESSSAASVPFPTTPGAFQTTSQGTPDAFVTKVNPTGTAFVYSTYLGGSVRDEAFGIAVDPSDTAHVIGQTRSTTFPLVSPFQSNCPSNGDCVFMASLNPAGAALVFSTFFGQGEGTEVAADNAGSIYATGVTYQGLANLPTMNPIQPNHGAGNSVFDAFVAKIEVRRIQTQRPLFDYDGDGKADLSVFRPSAGSWYISQSSNNAFIAVQFGASGDLIAPADFDGDGKTDISVFRPSDGGWYRLNSSNNTFSAFQFGSNGDL
ncbi:MAG TPA: SBBP repeat-containing protein, partial [Pyrinomonadaceae bacterium]